MATGYSVERFGQAYYGTEGADLDATTLVLSDTLYAVLTGSDPRAIECYADVSVGGVAVPYVESIDIERGIDGRIGLARIYVLCDADAIPAGIGINAVVTVTAGIRYAGTSAERVIFTGRLDEWTPPDAGDIRGVLIAYDDAKRFEDADVSGFCSGDLAAWIELQAAGISVVSGFSVVQKGDPIEIGRRYLVGVQSCGGPYPLAAFSDALEAINFFVSVADKRYVCVDGTGDMLLVDPVYCDAQDVQMTFSNLITMREITRVSERFNRVKYSNLIGSSFTIVNGVYTGTYNDTTDQGTYGVMELPGGVLNNLPISDAEMQTYAAAVADISQRRRWEVVTRFNPFLEVAGRHDFAGITAIVASVAHSLRAGSTWTTKAEVWGASA